MNQIATTPTTDDAQPFVRVMIDQDGRAIIALDTDAALAFADLLDALDLHDMMMNPGYHGMDADTANAQANVGMAIRSQISSLYHR